MTEGRVRFALAADLPPEERARHEGFMRLALRQAGRNLERPFGAVIVERPSGTVLAEAVNAVEVSPLLHGETAAIDACARSHRGVDWPALSLYTTAEPCPMCAAAIAWTKIGEVIVGSDTPTLARLGIDQFHLPCVEVLTSAPFYRGRVVMGVLAVETDRMYAEWARRLGR
ncbi:MAG: nucleoside deaminase [Rhodospirillales bacterium]|jgi:tRNA(Arg) A34 adenosine deaminase TadA|nr:nucleoside deaminase [Rhodospirillales bacterium]